MVQGPGEDPSSYETAVLGKDRCGLGRKSPLKSNLVLPRK